MARVGHNHWVLQRIERDLRSHSHSPEELRDHGYATAGITNVAWLAPQFRFSKGFQIYDHRTTDATNTGHRIADATTRAALSCSFSCAVSRTISGSTGGSYGAETPVNSGISPARARRRPRPGR